jgi:hypothetical protein
VVLCLHVNRDDGGLLAVAEYVCTSVEVFGVQYYVVSGVLSGSEMFSSFGRPRFGSGECVWLLGSGTSVVANVSSVVKGHNVDMLFLVKCDNGGVAPGLPGLAPPVRPVASNGGGAPGLRRGVGRPKAQYILSRVDKMVEKEPERTIRTTFYSTDRCAQCKPSEFFRRLRLEYKSYFHRSMPEYYPDPGELGCRDFPQCYACGPPCQKCSILYTEYDDGSANVRSRKLQVTGHDGSTRTMTVNNDGSVIVQYDNGSTKTPPPQCGTQMDAPKSRWKQVGHLR